MSKCSASWAIVRSPLMAASATFALKAGEWFRRGRLFMVSPVRGDHRRFQAEIPLIVLSRFPEPALCELGRRSICVAEPQRRRQALWLQTRPPAYIQRFGHGWRRTHRCQMLANAARSTAPTSTGANKNDHGKLLETTSSGSIPAGG